MKKMNFLKIAFTLVLAFVFTGIFAQTHNGTSVPGAGVVVYADGDVETSTYVTEGTTIPIYALPDAYFHPAYDVATSTFTLTDDFNWVWSGTATTSLTVTQGALDDNYVTVAAGIGDAAGSPYVLTVQERAPAAYGSCLGAAKNLTINVVTQPSFAINGGDATYDFCEGGAFPANINTTIAGGWENYHLAWNLEIATLDDASSKEFWYDDELGTTQFGVVTYAESFTQTTGGFDAVAAASATYDIMTVGSFLAIDNGTRDAVTVYTYTLLSVNDRASRFGDFITLAGDDTDASAYTDYAATAASDQVIITVYPAPATGPVYHIPNAWAN